MNSSAIVGPIFQKTAYGAQRGGAIDTRREFPGAALHFLVCKERVHAFRGIDSGPFAGVAHGATLPVGASIRCSCAGCLKTGDGDLWDAASRMPILPWWWTVTIAGTARIFIPLRLMRGDLCRARDHPDCPPIMTSDGLNLRGAITATPTSWLQPAYREISGTGHKTPWPLAGSRSARILFCVTGKGSFQMPF